MTSPRSRLIYITLAIAAAVLTISCGGSDDPTSTPASQTTPLPTGSVQATSTPLPPQAGAAVMFVIDQSGSMGADFGGMTRWEAIQRVFSNTGDGTPLAALAEKSLVGVTLYSGTGQDEGCPLKAGFSPGVDTLGRIGSMLNDSAPLSGAPTGEAIESAVSTLAVYQGTRVVVLITDGDPDTCAGQGSGVTGSDEALAATLTGYTRRVETVVVSLGDDASDEYLRLMANAGAGIPPSESIDASEEPELWRVSDVGELEDAIETITSRVEPLS